MTDYELLSLYAEYIQIMVTMVTVFVSVLFAYLVASYFVAEKLTRLQFWFVTVLFLGVSLDVVTGVRMHGARAVSLQTEIVRRIEAPNSTIAYVDPTGMPEQLPPILFVSYLLISLAAAVFAVQLRRRGS